jgi:hypothetical protein
LVKNQSVPLLSSARVTIALSEPGDDNGGGSIHFIALRSNLRLLSGERLCVIECC